MEEQTTTVKSFLRLTFASFSVSLLGATVLGALGGYHTVGFDLGLTAEGFSYHFVFQLITIAMANSAVSLLIDRLFKMLLWQILVTLPACLVTTMSLLIAFNGWIGEPQTWVIFIVGFTVMYAVIAAGLLIKLRLENKRYERLLLKHKDGKVYPTE